MKVIKKEIQTKHKTICYTHIESGSETICFMLSGAGYNYNKPLFYYATMSMLQNNIDVIHIHYSYEKQLLNNPLEEIIKTMMDDIDPVINEVLKNNEYNKTIFLGKSLGTIPIAVDLMKRTEFLNSRMILLTPLLKFDSIFESLLNSQHQGLLVIGDQDHHYNSNQMHELNKSNLMIEIVQNANHSLDIESLETDCSILALAKIMEKLKNTVNN